MGEKLKDTVDLDRPLGSRAAPSICTVEYLSNTVVVIRVSSTSGRSTGVGKIFICDFYLNLLIFISFD